MARKKEQTITLKVDTPLADALRGVPNRSRFIRDAILAALENTCPLCMGLGVLSPKQREHWDAFARSHTVRECPDCHELHLTCSRGRPRAGAAPEAPGPAPKRARPCRRGPTRTRHHAPEDPA